MFVLIFDVNVKHDRREGDLQTHSLNRLPFCALQHSQPANMFLRTARISHKQRPFSIPAHQTQRANYAAERSAAERSAANPAQTSSKNRFNIMLEAGG